MGIVVVSVALALGSGGCSWLFVQPLPPNYQSGDPPVCTSNVAAPVIDSLFSVLDTVELVSVAHDSEIQNKNAVLVGASLGIALWGASAIYGYSHTSECSEAQTSYRPYRRAWAPAPAYQPPAPPTRLPQPGPPAPPAPAPEGAAPPPKPPVTVPSAPAAPQQRDDDNPG